jgi:SAM-dependent methyltransferase
MSEDPSLYSDDFHRHLDATAEPSARRVFPLLLPLLRPQSSVDVGCGDGGWLAVARENGVSDVLGIEGPWIDEKRLKIPLSQFRRARLDEPLAIARRFDLALSLEVAEHLPPRRAAGLIAELARLAPVVLFSAAVPGQGGVDHKNEQWPSYWAGLFAREGYRAIDGFRFRLWDDPEIAFWYRQNLLLFASKKALAANPVLATLASLPQGVPTSVVHPELFSRTLRISRPRLGRWLKMMPRVLRRTFCRETATSLSRSPSRPRPLTARGDSRRAR